MKKKRTQHKKHITHTDTHIWLKKGLLVYAIIVFVLFVFISLSAYTLVNMLKYEQSQARLDRIEAIYTSLNLDGSYRQVRSDIFGDKRVYSWDKGRTYSSSVEYGRNATVDETFADLDKKILTAGFERVDTVHAESFGEQHHYKSDKGEYIRVAVSNRAWHDSMTYGTQLPAQEELNRRDIAPVYVVIKVNLDDNNE